MANPDADLCPTWICRTGATIHVAKNRGWFSSYTPFDSHAKSGYLEPMKVIGVGTVEIPVKISDHRHGNLRLKYVLHAPNAFCNIVAGHIFSNNEPKWCDEPEPLRNWKGRVVALVMKIPGGKGLQGLRLRSLPLGPVMGRSPFEVEGDREVVVHAEWADGECEFGVCR